MKYTIHKLDGRHTHHKMFDYYIGFSNRMPEIQTFAQAQKWFFETYGWSAEIRQYSEIVKWIKTSNQFVNPTPVAVPEECNPYWSWTNGYNNLRIYVKSGAELNFFQLRWPNE